MSELNDAFQPRLAVALASNSGRGGPGVMVQSQLDEVTGLSSVGVLDPKQRAAAGRDLRPVLKLVNAKGKKATFAITAIPAVYSLPAGQGPGLIAPPS